MNWYGVLAASIMLLILIYAILPELLLHGLGIGAWKRQYTYGVAITFDDGPDPEITPQILEILARHQVSATFFLVGEKAGRYADLVKLIQIHGHQIGAHSQHHRHAWLSLPWVTWREWQESIAALENLTCQPVEWIRPPWGAFNLALWLWMIVHNKRAILWNVEGHDWQARRKPEAIAARCLRRINEGAIVLLHDSGGEKGAPQNTLQALDIFCREIVEKKKLPLVKLKLPEWPLSRRVLFRAWEKWESFFARRYQVERINTTNIFRLSKIRYKGPEIYGPNQQLLAKTGDLVGEIHIDNTRLQNTHNNMNITAARALRQARKSMPELARYVAENQDYEGIRVFLGFTIINQGIGVLGFQVQDIPAAFSIRVISFLQSGIRWMINPFYTSYGNKEKENITKLVWMSRQQLLEKWLQEE